LKFWKFINYANIDVSLGACCAALAAQKYCHLDIHWTYFYLLVSSIWMVYTLDRLLDIKKLDLVFTKRHHFHLKNQNILKFLVIVGLIINSAITLTFAPLDLILFGCLMVLFSGLHFVLIHILQHKKSFWVMKEPAIATAYTLGIWAYPMFLKDKIIAENVIIVALFFLLALGNLMMLACIEEKIDIQSGFNSWIQNIGKERAEQWTKIILISGFAISLELLYSHWAWALAFILGYGIHLQVWLKPSYFLADEKYRRWTEISFIYPIVYYFLDFF